MCTGRAPFRAESSYGVLRRISDTRPSAIQDQNNEIPNWLCRLVDRLHAKRPVDRYSSAEEVASDLKQCLAHAQQPANEPLPARLASVTSPSWRLIALFAVGLVALLAIGIMANHDPDQAESSSPSQPKSPSVVVSSPDDESSSEQRPNITTDEFEWADGTDEELENLSAEIGQLEIESGVTPDNGNSSPTTN